MQNNERNEKISFKPLHEGVGFHPFSEGLPYAPQSTTVKTEAKPKATAASISPEIRTDYKKDYTQGSGAVSAGVHTFATPKTTRQIQQQNQQAHPQKVVAIQAAPKTQPYTAPTVSVIRKRFFAYLLDTVVHIGFWLIVNLIATVGYHFEVDASVVEANWFGFTVFFLFSQWFFIAMQEMLFETTVGKSFFGLEFKRNRASFGGSSLLLRSIIFMMGMLAGGLGLIFLPQDKIAEVQLKQS